MSRDGLLHARRAGKSDARRLSLVAAHKFLHSHPLAAGRFFTSKQYVALMAMARKDAGTSSENQDDGFCSLSKCTTLSSRAGSCYISYCVPVRKISTTCATVFITAIFQRAATTAPHGKTMNP